MERLPDREIPSAERLAAPLGARLWVVKTREPEGRVDPESTAGASLELEERQVVELQPLDSLRPVEAQQASHVAIWSFDWAAWAPGNQSISG